MIKFFPERIASFGLLFILSAILILHALVFIGILPYEMVWGGRLKSRADMIIFESISLFINALMLSVVLIRANIWKVKLNRQILKTAFWVMFSIYALNTIGNMASLNAFERNVFTPLTFILAILSWRLTIFSTKEND